MDFRLVRLARKKFYVRVRNAVSRLHERRFIQSPLKSEVALRQTSRAPIPGLGSSRQFVRSANEECKKVTSGTWD